MCVIALSFGLAGNIWKSSAGMVTVAAEGKEHDDKNDRVHKLLGKEV